MALAQGTAVRRRAAERLLSRLLPLAPLAIGIPVAVALARSLVQLVGLDHPFFGDVSGTSTDSYSLFLGGPLYQDPNAGYTPLAYPPLFALLGAGLDHVRLWTGWPVLVTMIAELGLIGLAARLAYRPAGRSRADQAIAIAGALGTGALVWWLVAFVPFNSLYAPRGDHLSWAMAFGALALVARGPSRANLAGSLVLLSLACWTKQTAVIAIPVALAALALAAAAGRTSWRTPVLFALVLAVVNGALFGLMDLATSGWAGRFLIDMPSRHPRALGFRPSLRQLVEAVAVPLTLVAALGAAAALERRREDAGWPSRPQRAWLWPARWEERFAAVVALFVAADFVPSAYFLGALGAAHNVLLGVAWGLGLLVAYVFGLCARRPGTALAAAAAVAGLFVVSESPGLQRRLHAHNVFVPPKSLRITAEEAFPGLRAYAAHRSVYHPVFTDLDGPRTGRLYQNYDNIAALLASGYQPGHLVRALLDRRFDVVFLLDDSRQRDEQIGAGTWEDDYLWKLNEVMRAKYRPLDPVPSELAAARHVPAGLASYTSPGVLERRPGPDPAPWMRHCFGPFHAAGTSWRIARGGGFWCRPGGRGPTLTLVRTRAAVSEVRADSAGGVADRSIAVSLPRSGSFAVAGGGGDDRWRVQGEATAGGRMSLLLTVGGRLFDAVAARPGRVRLVFADAGPARRGLVAAADGSVVVRLPRGAEGATSLRASRGSDASFDLAQLAR